MITQFFLDVGFTIVKFLFGWIDLPSTPETIQTAGDTFIELVRFSSSFLQLIFTPTLYIAILVIIGVILAFEQLWGITLFVAKKLPFLNIK